MSVPITVHALLDQMVHQVDFLLVDDEIGDSWEELTETLRLFNVMPATVRHDAKLQLVLGNGRPRIEVVGGDSESLSYRHATMLIDVLARSSHDCDPRSLLVDLWDAYGATFADRTIHADEHESATVESQIV